MTYRQAIQKLQKDIDEIYENVGVLQDAASPIEKEAWSKTREHLLNAYIKLGSLDNVISKNRADMELGYSI